MELKTARGLPLISAAYGSQILADLRKSALRQSAKISGRFLVGTPRNDVTAVSITPAGGALHLPMSGVDCDNDPSNRSSNGDAVSNLQHVENIEELEHALVESRERPVLLFKHSLTCPISTRAFNELQSYLDNPDPRISYKLITVQTAGAVSNEAASRLQLHHESPQAILVRNGREVWNASHFKITAAALDEAIRNTE